MMQTDVKSNHLNAAGSVVSGRNRLKGFSICPTASTACAVQFRDGSATGPILCEVDVGSNTNPNSFYVLIPGEGILFQTSIYLTLSASVVGVTAFYG
jgi:hypothetical protein